MMSYSEIQTRFFFFFLFNYLSRTQTSQSFIREPEFYMKEPQVKMCHGSVLDLEVRLNNTNAHFVFLCAFLLSSYPRVTAVHKEVRTAAKEKKYHGLGFKLMCHTQEQFFFSFLFSSFLLFFFFYVVFSCNTSKLKLF